MKHWILSAALVAVMSMASASAQELDSAALKSKLQQQLGMTVSNIEPSPVPGLYQALTERGLFYVSEDGSFLIHGRVYNMNQGLRNETEQALAQVRLNGIKQFEDGMIEFKADNEKHQVTVFTDPTCGYCRKLHSQIDEYNERGITVRYLAFPRGGLNSKTYNDMVSIWCADDAQQAITDAKAGKTVANAECANQVRQQYEFGQQVGVTGTPALVLDDGSMIPGYQPPARLVQALNQAGS